MAFEEAKRAIEGHELSVIARLGIDWTARSRKKIRCPLGIHADNDPSFRWDDAKRRAFCTCGNYDIFDLIALMKRCDVKEAVDMAMEWAGIDRPKAPRPRANGHANGNGAHSGPLLAAPSRDVHPGELDHSRYGKPSAIWPYTDAKGVLVEFRVRYDGPAVEKHARKPKEVIPFRWSGQRWVMGQMAGYRPLYCLPDFFDRPEAPILITEGEKAADGGQKIFPGYIVSTSSGGAQASSGMDWSPVKGRDVTIWPDNDAEGLKYADSVARHARNAGARSVRIVAVPEGTPPKHDLADDWPDSMDLHAVLEDAREVAPQERQQEKAPTAAKKRDTGFLVTLVGALQTILIGQWRIKRMLPAHGLMVIYGGPGCGKSFLALDVALHIASGRNWAGCQTHQGAAIYVAAEGQAGFANRVCAAREQLGLPDDTPFGLIITPPNLGTEKGDADRLIEEISTQCDRFGWYPSVFVIDTLSRTMFGADESSADGMGSFIANAGKIAEAFDCLVIAVHHTGKDEARGMRGWSGLHGACDAEWEVSKEGSRHTVTTAKMKDGDDGLTWDFALAPVELGRDEDGDPVTSCVVKITSEPKQKDDAETVSQRKPLKGQNAEFMKAIKWAVEDGGEVMKGVGRCPPGVKGVRKQVLKIYVENLNFFDGREHNARRAILSRHIRDLAGNKYIAHWNEWVWIL